MEDKKSEVIKKTVEVKEVVKPEVVVKPIAQVAPVKSLKFKNTGDGKKIKLVDGKTFKWITVKKGDIVSIPRKIALRNKLVEVK